MKDKKKLDRIFFVAKANCCQFGNIFGFIFYFCIGNLFLYIININKKCRGQKRVN